MKKALTHLKSADPVLGGIIERVGPYKIQYRDPNFHTLVRSIVYQQLSGKAALTIFNRLTAAAKTDPLTPESILKLRPARMRSLGLSKQKLTYIRELARMTRDGQVRFDSPHARRRGDHRALHPGERRRRLDRADVPDVRFAPSGRAADGRPGRPRGHEEGLRSAGIAHAGGDGKDRGGLAALLFGGVLVSVAQPG